MSNPKVSQRARAQQTEPKPRTAPRARGTAPRAPEPAAEPAAEPSTARAGMADSTRGTAPEPAAEPAVSSPRSRNGRANTSKSARNTGAKTRSVIPNVVTLPDGRKYWRLINDEWLAVDGDVITLRAERGVRFAQGTVITHPNNGTIIETPEGKPVRAVAFMMPDNKPGRVLIEGTVIEASSQMAYEIEPDRTLSGESGRRSITATWEDNYRNVMTGTASVSRMRQAQNAEWTEPFGFLVFDGSAMLAKYLRARASHNPNCGIAIRGQGPINGLNGELILATVSGCYDEYGNRIAGYYADMTDIRDGNLRQLHDITPPESLARENIHAGFKWAEDFLSLMPGHPGITATLLGQIGISVLAPLHIKYFVPVWIAAKTGLGKTYLIKITKMIQSARIRDIRNLLPEVNLGPNDGTGKGPSYRVPAFGLGTVLADDVFTAFANAHDRAKRSGTVDNLVRGREEGAAAIGHVDRIKNRLDSGAAGRLSASIVFTAEDVPPKVKGEITSTANRLIVHEWKAESWREVFDSSISQRLTDNAEDGHAAYSALTLWVWSHRSQVETLYQEAERITAGWDMRGFERVQYRYTAVVTGLLCWREVMREYGYQPKRHTLIADAIEGARKSAETQASSLVNNTDILSEFIAQMRLAFADGYLVASGRPVRPGADDVPNGAPVRVLPYRITGDDDRERPEFPTGIIRPEQIGLNGDDLFNPVRKRADAVPVYVKPPTSSNRGKQTRYGSEWLFVMPIKDEMTFERVCRALTRARTDGLEFRPDEMREIITARIHEPYGFSTGKLRIFAVPSDDRCGNEDGKSAPQKVMIIPTALVFENDGE